MKKINKGIVLALLVAMTITCTACGGTDSEVISGQVTTNESQETSSNAGSITPAESTETADTQSSVETPAPTEEPVSEEAELEETPLSLGRIQGGVYTNEYAGITCELDSNWEFYTAEELQELPAAISDLAEGTDFGDALENVSQIMDMQAENVNDLTVMNVLYQKLTLAERLAYSTLTEEEVIDAVLTQSDSMIESYGQMGITVKDITKKTVNYLGEEHVAIHTTATIQDMDYFILQLFDFDLGQYSVTVTLSSYFEDKTEQLVELFSKYE